MGNISFTDRVVIITGAGGGLGKSHALAFANLGAKVVVNDLGGAVDGTGDDESPAAAVVAEIQRAGGEAVADYNTVSTPEGGAAIVRTALGAFGRIDVLVNNAGILRDVTLAKMEPAQVEAVLGVHLLGAFYVTLPAFRAMKGQGYGRIIFTSSGSGLWGNFGQANYAAAKMGMIGLMNTTSIEGAKYGIMANAIAPMADSRMTKGILPDDMAKIMLPETVTPLVLYLASEACEVTHHIYSVGGGRIARVVIALHPAKVYGKGAVVAPDQIAQDIDSINGGDPLMGPAIPDGLMSEFRIISQEFGQ